MRRRNYLVGLGTMAAGVSSGCSMITGDRLTITNVKASQTAIGAVELTVTIKNLSDKPRGATLVGILDIVDGKTQRERKPVGVPAGETRTFVISILPSFEALNRRARYTIDAALEERRTVSETATLDGMYQSTDETPVVEPQEASEELPGPWPSFHYGNRNTGFNPTISGIETEPSVRWQSDEISSVYDATAPVVVDGTVYAGSEVTALDTRTGERRWTLDEIDRTSPMAVADGRLFFGTEPGEFVAVDSDSGEVQWRFAGEYETWFGGAAVVDGVVYTAEGIATGDLNRGAVHAFDAETGTRQWKFETDGRFKGAPAVVDGTVYAGRFGNVVHALDAETGEVTWQFETDAHVVKSPAVAYETVYVGSDDAHLYALDRESGAKRWATELGDWIEATPAVAHGMVFVSNTGDNRLHAVDAATGDVRWQFEAGDEINSSPSVAGRTVYIGSYDNTLYALDIETGDVRWQFDAKESVIGSFALGDGELYCNTYGGAFYALEV